jgi:hypothetical protein
MGGGPYGTGRWVLATAAYAGPGFLSAYSKTSSQRKAEDSRAGESPLSRSPSSEACWGREESSRCE